MGTISDYIKWRGDLSFTREPFNEVDNLILAQIAYVDLSGIVSEGNQECTLAQASAAFFEQHSEDELKKVKTFIKDTPFLMKEAAQSERFGSILLSHYRDIYNEEKEEQFAAMQMRLSAGMVYLAFRGTDDSIIGWKEDFNMSFITPVPAQLDAVNYVNERVEQEEVSFYLGGHSKGGNLAIYSAVHAKKEVQKRIVKVFNNDGPGFDAQMINSTEYQNIKEKICTIVPYHSFVGMLLEHDSVDIVVKSNQRGIMEHDAMSWQVLGKKFVMHTKVSHRSYVTYEAMKTWINGLDKKDRAKFVDTLFAILTASGATTLSDVNSDIFKSAGASIKMFNALDADTRAMMSRMLWTLSDEFSKARKKR